MATVLRDPSSATMIRVLSQTVIMPSGVSGLIRVSTQGGLMQTSLSFYLKINKIHVNSKFIIVNAPPHTRGAAEGRREWRLWRAH